MKNKLFLCKKRYADFEIGNFYKIEKKTHFLNHNHYLINGSWFTTELGDNSFFPSLYTYFLDDVEERKLKLKMIELETRLVNIL